VTTTVLLFIFGVAVIAFAPRIGGRISRYNYGDNPGARRLTIIVTVLAGIVLIAFGSGVLSPDDGSPVAPQWIQSRGRPPAHAADHALHRRDVPDPAWMSHGLWTA
jgi:hypothetical protein